MDFHSRKVVEENRDYTMFSWAVQGASAPIHMKRGQGVWFWDGDDNRWLDFSSQLINLNVGHQHPKMLEAIKKQVDELCFAGPSFATEPRGLLGKKLAEVTGLAKAFFTLGGSEANENAMKMAKLFTGREKIITRYRSYHGATMGSMTRLRVIRGAGRLSRASPESCGCLISYRYRCPLGKKWKRAIASACHTSKKSSRWKAPHRLQRFLLEGITGSNGCWCRPTITIPSCARCATNMESC